ncbi:MAG: PD-(D/E)XK nuclease family protein, partial [Bacteroidota bacterium]
MAKTPGLNGEGWYLMKNRYFNELDQRASEDDSINVAEIRRQFNLWFERKRYPANKKVPKSEVIEIFDELRKWAAQEFDRSNKKNSSFAVLREQAQRILDLLRELPASMNFLSMLELERIVRTIYEPSPVVFKAKEVDHLNYVHQSSATIGPVHQLVWWNFIQNERDHFFSRWYPSEMRYLQRKGLHVASPQEENDRLLWQRPRALLYCQQKALLIIPEKVNGQTVFPHPLHDELAACFGDLSSITYSIDQTDEALLFAKAFQLPQQELLAHQALGRPKAFLHLHAHEALGQNEEETFSSLNSLFYYPYQWVFRHKIGLRQSSILSIVPDITLMGNLSHRFFELLLKEPLTQWDKTSVYRWVDEQAPKLLSREGAVLLMYGREPEKIAFLNRIKYAAWSLVAMIQQNGWEISGTEKAMARKFFDIPIKGKADLVLKRGEEWAVVDLKWRGASRRARIIKNEEDLQLVLYSKLLTEEDQWAHTAYFILENGQMIARNQ